MKDWPLPLIYIVSADYVASPSAAVLFQALPSTAVLFQAFLSTAVLFLFLGEQHLGVAVVSSNVLDRLDTC